MNGTYADAVKLAQQVVDRLERSWRGRVDVVMCPPFTALRGVSNVIAFDRSFAQVGAQDCHTADAGAFTGEISAAMLSDLDCSWCIVGHSERRTLFGETDADVAAQCTALARHGISPIVCVGEPAEVYDAGDTVAYVAGQVRASPRGGDADRRRPRGRLRARLGDRQRAASRRPSTSRRSPRPCARLSREVRCDKRAASARILYGGSVKPGNCRRVRRRAPTWTGCWSVATRLNAEAFVDIVGRVHRCVTSRRCSSSWTASGGRSLARRTRSRPPRPRSLDALLARYPHTTLGASGPDVGLPEGQMGNSEVGHLNIGAGRVVMQELMRIDHAVETGEFFEQPRPRRAALDAVARSKATLHLMGLALRRGRALVPRRTAWPCSRMAAERGVRRVRVHAFLDGRDVEPGHGRRFRARSSAAACANVSELRRGRATRAWRVGVGPLLRDGPRQPLGPGEARLGRHRAGEGDGGPGPGPGRAGELRSRRHRRVRRPVRLRAETAAWPTATPSVFFNFRPDRARELTRAFVDPAFDGFDRGQRARASTFVSMTEYDPALDVEVAFPKDEPRQRPRGRPGRRTACASSTPPRPRSTHT